MKETVVCIDRDGTLIYDDHYCFGESDKWHQKLELMEATNFMGESKA